MESNPLEPRPVPLANGWRWIAEAAILFRRQPVTWNLMFLLLFSLELVFLIPVLRPALAVIHGTLMAGVLLAARELRSGRPARAGQLFSAFMPRQRFGQLLLLSLLLMLGFMLIMVVTSALTQFTLGSERITKLVDQMNAWDKDPSHFDPSQLDPEPLTFSSLVIAALSVPLLMAGFFAPARIVLDGRPVILALRESFRACIRNMGPFLVYALALLGLLALALVPVAAAATIALHSGGRDNAIGMATLVILLEILMFRPVLALSVYTAYGDVFPSSVSSLAPLLQGIRRPPP